MAIKNFKPTTNARRKMSTLVNEEITKTTPEKSLTVIMKKNGGRNNQGKITVRHHGGGEKRKYRIIDFKRNKFDIEGSVASIEYDPNRSANIALINYIATRKVLKQEKVTGELFDMKSIVAIVFAFLILSFLGDVFYNQRIIRICFGIILLAFIFAIRKVIMRYWHIIKNKNGE